MVIAQARYRPTHLDGADRVLVGLTYRNVNAVAGPVGFGVPDVSVPPEHAGDERACRTLMKTMFENALK